MALARRRDWGPDSGPGRWGIFWIAIWTFFLLQPLSTAWARRDTIAGWVGIVSTIAFGVFYVSVFAYQRRRGFAERAFHLPVSRGLAAITVALGLAIVDCVAIGQDATATAVYLCVMCVMALPGRWALLAVVNAAGWTLACALVPGWHVDSGLLLSMLTASVAVWGIQQMLLGNIELRRANDDNKRLAVNEERGRFARDLHDILGHSLTVITVKAELANKLLDVDPARARAELADLERLSRDALTDVRRAVEGYRELTLPGELARARTALEAAQIEADLPNSTDEVPTDKRELFAWTIREGITNVIRHSNATRCSVVLYPDRVEIRDNGSGVGVPRVNGSTSGHGLVGLRERAGAVGGTVITRTLEPGFSLSVVAP